VSAVDLNTFIRLFVNHRPVYGIGKNNIQEAFESLFNEDNKERGMLTRGRDLYRLLLYRGVIKSSPVGRGVHEYSGD